METYKAQEQLWSEFYLLHANKEIEILVSDYHLCHCLFTVFNRVKSVDIVIHKISAHTIIR